MLNSRLSTAKNEKYAKVLEILALNTFLWYYFNIISGQLSYE